MLGKTDHDHVGKLLTYGAALDASTLVLVATDFTEEHQKTLEWLNESSSENVGFFGVRLELWKFDESRPAARFTVLTRPNTATRRAAKASAGEDLTPTAQLQLSFWTQFEQRLRESGEVPSTQTPRPQYWYNVALGRSYIHLSCFLDTWGRRIGVRVYLQSRVADEALEQLLKDREEIERELGSPLKWNPHPGKMDKTIVLEREADIESLDSSDEHLDWLVDATLRMRKVFSPRVRVLRIG